MLPNPLHPAIVHFPIVLTLLLPLVIIGALWSIRRGAVARRAWLVPTAVAVALAGSAWLSVRSGGAESERVEQVVGDAPLDAHEDLAEAFLTASAAMALLTAAGLLGGVPGRAVRGLTVAGSVALAGLVVLVGHTGGELVYRHAAASAYAVPTTADGSHSAAVTPNRQ